MEIEEHEKSISLWSLGISSVMLIGSILATYMGVVWFQHPLVGFAWYAVAYLPVGFPVMKEAWEAMHKGDFMSEFMLMSLAAIGAFVIGEYPEAVAVMLLYCIGEALQDRAVDRARDHIRALVGLRPDKARRLNGGDEASKSPNVEEIDPTEVNVEDIIEVKVGERVPLDGILLTENASFNTSALTGESLPAQIERGGEVLAGMIAFDSVVRLSVMRPSGESAISRVLKMVQEASERKASTELFVRKFAHIYTPIVIILAVFTVLLPWLYSLVSSDFAYIFSDWLNRALVFLVVSCPCALVISIPLGYFGGIGVSSKRGILFKGSNYLDAMTTVDTVVFDKTGTLTNGSFSVEKVDGLDENDLRMVAAIEQSSPHPIARAIVDYVYKELKLSSADTPASLRSLSGYGLEAEGWAVGNLKLLESKGISYPETLKEIPETIVAVAKNTRFIGYILLADMLKEDAVKAVSTLNTRVEILSGDKRALVDKVARQLKITHAYGELLPDDKVAHIEELKHGGHKVAFVGDGINDAPVLALSDVGIAMGALGTDMAVETADVIIQTDQPSKVAEAISIAKRTRRIVRQNIVLALGVKAAVMILGIFGLANLWEAVFADSGVALLAVLNSSKIFLRSEK